MKELEIKSYKNLLDNLFKNYIKEDGFICGGFTRNCLLELKKPVSSDIDIYCHTEASYELIKNRLIENGYEIRRETPMSIAYKVFFEGEFPIQLIKPLNKGHVITVGSVEEIINNFDFTIVRAGIYLKDGVLVSLVDDDFEEDNKEKKLRIKNIHCPIAEIYRVAKYINKGFFLPVLESLKILNDWLERDDEYKLAIMETIIKQNPSKEEIEHLEALLHID